MSNKNKALNYMNELEGITGSRSTTDLESLIDNLSKINSKLSDITYKLDTKLRNYNNNIFFDEVDMDLGDNITDSNTTIKGQLQILKDSLYLRLSEMEKIERGLDKIF